MASSLWGNVYFKDIYAGRLQEEPSGSCVFAYDDSYLRNANPKIAHSLPLRKEPYRCESGLHPFFDNLLAEGWFQNAQARALGVDTKNRFALLLGFGHDLAGAVSIIDPNPQEYKNIEFPDEAIAAALAGRASLSGVQRKLLIVKDGTKYRPTKAGEISTHIAKLSSGNLPNIIELEFLTTLAIQKLLPDDDVVELEIVEIPAINEPALVIKRFDRTLSGKRLYHFEEFNQLLEKKSGDDKYSGGYADMANFIRRTPDCIPAEIHKLFLRILAYLLIGNSDAHLKNFAMFHTRDGLRLTPSYDSVASAIYPEYQFSALKIMNIDSLKITDLQAKHVVGLAEEFGVNEENLVKYLGKIEKNLHRTIQAIEKASVGTKELKSKLITMTEKRWNGSFASTGRLLSARQSKGVKNKN